MPLALQYVQFKKSIEGRVVGNVSVVYYTLLGRLLRVNLIKWVANVRPSVHPFVHKKFFDFNEIWYVCRGR